MARYGLKNDIVSQFKYGVITALDDDKIPNGAASNELNFLSGGDQIEIRRGFIGLGIQDSTAGGSSQVMVGRDHDGNDVIYKKVGRKLYHYNATTTAWDEVGTDLFPAAAVDDELSYANYMSFAGAQLWFSTPNSDIYKIMTANPTNYSTMTSALSGTTIRGRIKIKLNRMYVWNLPNNRNTIYLSHVDASTKFTAVTNEVIGSGNGVTKTFTATLAFKAGGAKRTCFGVSVTDGTETFSDDYNGGLVGNLGGTGTINYTTGAISVTFNTAPANTPSNVKANYSWEDASVDGIADFSFTSTRVAGEGAIILQDEGGPIQNIFSYNSVEYCFHEKKIYQLTLSADDLTITNLIYRDNAGIPCYRAGIDTGQGVFYVDVSDDNKPQIRVLSINTYGTQVIPTSISDARLDLTNYVFDSSSFYEWDDYILISCRTKDSAKNNRIILWDKAFKLFDILDYYASNFGTNEGTLIAGDSVSNNVYTLFSGTDDDDASVYAVWEGNLTKQETEYLKRFKKLWVQGAIGPEQKINVYLSYDNGGYTQVGQISGDGFYVDKGQKIDVGSVTIGSKTIGGGGDGLTAYRYFADIKVNADKYYEVKIKFETAGNYTGYFSVSEYKFFDVKTYLQKAPNKYRT